MRTDVYTNLRYLFVGQSEGYFPIVEHVFPVVTVDESFIHIKNEGFPSLASWLSDQIDLSFLGAEA